MKLEVHALFLLVNTVTHDPEGRLLFLRRSEDGARSEGRELRLATQFPKKQALNLTQEGAPEGRGRRRAHRGVASW